MEEAQNKKEITSRRKRFRNNLFLGLISFLILNSVFIVLLILVRVYEYLYLQHTLTLPADSLTLELSGIGRDFLMFLNIATYSFFPYIFVFLLSKNLAKFLIRILLIIFILTEVGLIRYLGATSLMLGADLFGYSFREVFDIISANGGFSIPSIITIIISIALIFQLISLANRLKPGWLLAFSFLLLSILSLGFRQMAIPESGKFKSEMAYNLVTNKAYHLLLTTYRIFYPIEKNEASLYSYFYIGQASVNKYVEYASNEYPFLHRDLTPDILGKYFVVGTKKPNLVFLIVESLGRAYSGEGAYLKSFTPFLDSLENHSLYWENVVSTAGKTFEVLPSVFGSMPYGISGFAEIGEEMPEGMTLISLLKERGYTSHFFYGGDADFDNMKLFLDKQHIDAVTDQNDFGPGYVKMPSNLGNFTWGFGDKDIFKRSFEKLSAVSSAPRLDIYLTLAMHDPYLIPDEEYYYKKVEEKFNEFNFTESQKKEYRKYLDNYATIIYFDDALRYFFNEYKKRDDFGNTIFFITGDHRMSTPPISSQIDRFHVPLVVYSPMLKSRTKFSSVVSHLDLTPSVVAFLKRNYSMQFPTLVPWLGEGLDSTETFRSISSIPLIRTKNEMIDYLDQDYFLVNNQLFKVSQNLEIDQVTNDKQLNAIERKFEKFKMDNLKACYNQKLIPDSLKYKGYLK
jgi:uncharacterized sulfatase